MARSSNTRRRSEADINAANLMERGKAHGLGISQRARSMPTPSAGQMVTHTAPSDLDEWNREELLPGYPSFAEFLGSDERWMMFRRNSSVQARLILEKQDDMRTLEEELLEMDIDDLAKEPREPNNSRRRLFTRHRTNEEEAKARRELLKKLENSYLEYERLLSAAYRLNTLPRPAAFEWKSVLEYVRSAKPIVKRESDYIHARGDLISLRGTTEHAYLGGLIEQFFNQIRDWTTVLEQRQRFSMRTWLKGNYVAKGAGEKFARAFIGVMVLLLVPVFFTVPIYALTKIGDDIGKSIGALVAFALTFAAVLLTATPARQHEVLGGTAAYLAVLVVFFGSLRSS